MINGYFTFILATVIGFYALDFIANLLNLRSLKPKLPSKLSDVYDGDKYAESQAYTRETTRFGIIESTFSLVVFLIFWFVGGFQWVDGIARSLEQGPIVTGLIFVGILYLGNTLISLPFTIWDTFKIEQKYGFNKTTPGTFITDRLKGIVLAAAIGAPLFALILFLFGKFGSEAWLYGWITVTLFSVAMMYIYPQWIMPLFNKFEPLKDGELKEAINEMSKKCEFPLTEVFEMDGSKRSTKSNAFFAGFGKNKKIALFDTLIKNHTVGELVAVLAHEIGHFKKKHIMQSMVLGILQMGILFFLLGKFMENRGLFDAFGVQETSVYCSIVFFSMLFEPISKLLSIGMSFFSRKNEYEADAYAAEVTGKPEDLISGLKTLAKDNLSNLTPHPFYVFMYYSHPPMLQRITALEKLR